MLKEKWKSVLFHVTNKHKWNGYTHFHECCHPRLTSAQIRKKKWLKPDTPAYIALEEVVLNKKILKDIEELTEFCHTGKLEMCHSEYLKYCPKREHFSHKGLLAVHNSHHLITMQTVEESRPLYSLGHVLVKPGTRLASQRHRNSGCLSQ